MLKELWKDIKKFAKGSLDVIGASIVIFAVGVGWVWLTYKISSYIIPLENDPTIAPVFIAIFFGAPIIMGLSYVYINNLYKKCSTKKSRKVSKP